MYRMRVAKEYGVPGRPSAAAQKGNPNRVC
jgi:hypothetical protein